MGFKLESLWEEDTIMRAEGKPRDGMAPPEVGNATGSIYVTLDW